MLATKKLLLAVVWVFFTHSALAQHHNNTWFRGTFGVPFGKKLKGDFELQHRRQDGLETDNQLKNNLMNNFRIWVQYQLRPDIKFSVSPLAYFKHYKIIQNQSDKDAKPSNELRFAAAVDLQHELFSKFYITDRNALEYRIHQGNSPDVVRLRNRLGLRYELSKKINLSVYDEILLNVHGRAHDHFFDHDRLGVNLEYKLFRKVKLDFGFMHVVRLNNHHTLKESNVVINLNYTLKGFS